MKLFFLAILFPVLFANAQSQLDAKIMETAKQLNCPQPDERNPVTLNAQLVKQGDSPAIIVKAQMAAGWHIYAYVPSTQPYIAIDQILQLPEAVRAVGEWRKSEPEASSDDPGVLLYKNEAVFIHKAIRSQRTKGIGVIKTGLYYQTCNLHLKKKRLNWNTDC